MIKLKKLALPLLGIAMLLGACGEKAKQETYVLNGQIASSEYDGSYVYLQSTDLSTNETVNIDSAAIQNGKFTFTENIKGETPSVGLLSYQGNSRSIPFIIEKGTIDLNIDSTKQKTIKGSPLNDLYQNFVDNASKANSTAEYQEAIYNYIKANLNSPVGIYFLMTKGKALNAEELKELISTASSIKPEIVNYKNFNSLEVRIKTLEATALGKSFSDLKGITPEGKEVSLSEFAGKGNYTLIDFWASWCPPCRKEMPAVVALYDQYKNKGFNIVGISLDDNNVDWKKGIAELHISWPQISDLKGWKSSLAEAYGVTSIPQTFLLDKEGTIIAKGFDAEELAVKLQELVK